MLERISAANSRRSKENESLNRRNVSSGFSVNRPPQRFFVSVIVCEARSDPAFVASKGRKPRRDYKKSTDRQPKSVRCVKDLGLEIHPEYSCYNRERTRKQCEKG